MIRILIVDDSATQAALFKHLFEKEADMCVIGCAGNGKEAVEMAATLQPDLITMDIQMPIMNGFEAIKLIMTHNPIPIVVISSTVNSKFLNTTFHALEAGAVGVIEKPVNALSPSFELERKRMINLIRGMAAINVGKRRLTDYTTSVKSPMAMTVTSHNFGYEILVIGASVGGPQALKVILSNMPANYPMPIVIVQHIMVGFIDGFCRWLNDHCPQSIKCAEHNEVLQPGNVYFAPENYHTKINRVGCHLVSVLEKSSPVSGFCPSITVLFQSVAKTCGKHAIGMLLTGMGNDGAQGLLELKQKNAHTLIQDAKSCVVYGMAGVAESLGAVDKIIKLEQIAHYLTTFNG